MSAYTKEELRALLANHGVELPSTSAKKEELIALYEEFVEPIEKSKGEFSSDDEEVVLSSNATKKKTSRKSSRPSTPAKSSSERSQVCRQKLFRIVLKFNELILAEDLHSFLTSGPKNRPVSHSE
jgi:hypothetical protein